MKVRHSDGLLFRNLIIPMDYNFEFPVILKVHNLNFLSFRRFVSESPLFRSLDDENEFNNSENEIEFINPKMDKVR